MTILPPFLSLSVSTCKCRTAICKQHGKHCRHSLYLSEIVVKLEDICSSREGLLAAQQLTLGMCPADAPT